MKRIVMTLVAVMTLTLGYAKTEVSSIQHVNHNYASFDKLNKERFDMNCDMRRLAVVLDLTESQMDVVEVIQQIFVDEMRSLADVRGPQCRLLVHQAVKKDMTRMQRVLNDKQFDTYSTLLRTTLKNKRL